MRDRCIITISDYRGSRHFSLSGLLRRLLGGALAVLALVMLGSFLFIQMLSGKVSDLNDQIGRLTAQQEQIRYEKNLLLEEKASLVTSVAHKSQGLDILGEELNHIEALIGLKPSPDKPIHERIDTASQTALEKRVMLDSIPSGYPVDSRVITSRFGRRIHPVHGHESFHGGVDLRSPRGAPVRASADGVVEWAALHRESGLGKMIILVHNFGFTSTYAHLDEIKVKVGAFVKKGEVIGHVGSTGVSTAPHLHYEVRYLKRRLNPKPFMDWSMEEYDIVFEKEDRIQWQSLAKAVRRNVEMPQRQWSQEKLTWSGISR